MFAILQVCTVTFFCPPYHGFRVTLSDIEVLSVGLCPEREQQGLALKVRLVCKKQGLAVNVFGYQRLQFVWYFSQGFDNQAISKAFESH